MGSISFSQLPSNPASFGLVCNFLAHYPPFDAYDFGLMIKTLRLQLDHKAHVIGSINDELVSYVGWIGTSSEIAEAWSAGDGPLHPTPTGDAVAVTILATRSSHHILPMIRNAKQYNGDKSVFWKRDFIDQRSSVKRAVRKNKP